MKFIKKKKKGVEQLHPVVVKIAARFGKALKSLAVWLQRKTNSYSPAKRKIILILFCICLLSGNLFVILHSLTKTNEPFYAVTPIRILPLLKQEKLFHYSISDFEFERIHQFKHLLDSLHKNDKIKFDSLLSERPHLTDTINLLENLYHEQQSDRK